MLPRKLAQGDGIGLGVVEPCEIIELNMEDDRHVDVHIIRLKIDVGNTKRSTILKKLRMLNPVSCNYSCV